MKVSISMYISIINFSLPSISKKVVGHTGTDVVFHDPYTIYAVQYCFSMWPFRSSTPIQLKKCNILTG